MRLAPPLPPLACSTRALLLVALAAGSPVALADDRPEDPVGAGLRDRLAGRGLTFELALQADHSSAWSGGQRGTALRRPLALTLDLDGAPLVGWRGARLHASVQIHEGRHGGELAGDSQGFDNADAEPFRQLSELWLEQRLREGRLRLKLGKADANADFARVGAAAGFLNSSAGFSPTIAGFPSYPDPAAGAALFARPAAWLSLGAGLYDGATLPGCHGRTGSRGPSTLWGAPSALFLIGEVEALHGLGGRVGRVGAGTWHHTSGALGGAKPDRRPLRGSYLVLEQELAARDAAGAPHGPALFAQAGVSDGTAGELDRHLSLGLAWVRPRHGRDDDQVGLMVSAARFGVSAGPGRQGRHETVLELFYDWRALPRLNVKPDLQLVLDPGGRGERPALLFTLRATLVL